MKKLPTPKDFAGAFLKLLKRNGKVEIPKIGVFELGERAGNPNNPHIDEPEKYNVVNFRASKNLKRNIQDVAVDKFE